MAVAQRPRLKASAAAIPSEHALNRCPVSWSLPAVNDDFPFGRSEIKFVFRLAGKGTSERGFACSDGGDTQNGVAWGFCNLGSRHRVSGLANSYGLRQAIKYAECKIPVWRSQIGDVHRAILPETHRNPPKLVTYY